jgi:hypothetical protein
VDLYLELGKKRVFACAVEWPGLSRSGRDEASAIESLLSSVPRYAKAIRSSGLPFQPPAGASALIIVERLPGDSTTDFGAPAAIPAADRLPSDAADVARLLALLDAAWGAFEAAEAMAEGVELQKGPRGGGRDLDSIRRHVLEAHAHYLKLLGGSPPRIDHGWTAEARLELRQASVAGLAARARGELPDTGLRGGERWSARTFARRAVWHLLDHAWEIENRAT